jgi:hypothetical protein
MIYISYPPQSGPAAPSVNTRLLQLALIDLALAVTLCLKGLYVI